MASRTAKRSALMSIRPQFASAILEGTKTVEFRKRALANDIHRVIIYTTSPVQAVVGEFTIARQVIASPRALWRRYSKVAGIDRRSFFEYFEGTTHAVGIIIDVVTEYETPVSIEEIEPGARPPQSFKYVTAA
jgi:predicted transcriptional regulator